MATEKRRTFIRKSVMASAGITLEVPAFIRDYAKIQPSDILNVGVIGINDRGGFYGGSGHTANFTKIKETRVTAICDCVEYLLPKAVADIEKLGGAKPATYIDYRKMLEDKNLDVVSIAAPDYWHALMTIHSCQTGRDVYVEKPLAYNIDEGRKLIFDGKTERYVNDDGANSYLSRPGGGRKPYNIPESI